MALGFLTRIRKKIHFIYVYMQKPLNFSIKWQSGEGDTSNSVCETSRQALHHGGTIQLGWVASLALGEHRIQTSSSECPASKALPVGCLEVETEMLLTQADLFTLPQTLHGQELTGRWNGNSKQTPGPLAGQPVHTCDLTQASLNL